MPEWLKALLLAQGSLGFADTLQQVVGFAPQYQQIPDAKLGGNIAGQVLHGEGGVPILGLTPFTLKHYGETGHTFRPGYSPLDPNQKMGDAVLAHEFGHIAASGVKNAPLADLLIGIDPTADNETSERFAGEFQNAIQFLRDKNPDTKKLAGRTKQIVEVLLQQPIYHQHPLNTSAAFGSLARSKQ